MIRALPTSALLILFLLACGPAHADQLICCGWDEVFIIEVNGGETKPKKKQWSWKAAGREDLPESFQPLFRTTDDCKPVDGGKRILISSSTGGVALVEHPDGNVLWYGRVGNAHSIEWLPNDRIVVAGSTHADGNRVVVFDIAQPNKPLFQDELHSGHGVVWDAQRNLLWALGYDELRAYRLKDWNTSAPKLEQTATHTLPAPGGHDLSPVPGTAKLIVTSSKNVFYFDRDKATFDKHAILGDQAKVKCVSIHPKTGRTVWIQAEDDEWWSPRIRFLEPEAELRLEGERLYKVRWLLEED